VQGGGRVSLESVLRTKLLTLSAVTAYTGTGDSARIRPDRLHATDTLGAANGAVIIEPDGEDPLNDLEGKSRRRMAQVTLRCRSRQREVARNLAAAVQKNGTAPGTGLSGATWTDTGVVYDAWCEGEDSSFTPNDDGSDQGWYDVFLSYWVTYAEAP